MAVLLTPLETASLKLAGIYLMIWLVMSSAYLFFAPEAAIYYRSIQIAASVPLPPAQYQFSADRRRGSSYHSTLPNTPFSSWHVSAGRHIPCADPTAHTLYSLCRYGKSRSVSRQHEEVLHTGQPIFLLIKKLIFRHTCGSFNKVDLHHVSLSLDGDKQF